MDWIAECKKWHEAALSKRLGKPYDTVTPFMMRTYPLPAPDCVIWIPSHGMDDRGRALLQILNENMRASKPAAVLIQSDAWFIKSDKFGPAFGMADLPYEKWQERYWEILNRDFDGTLGNVPREFRGEAIFTYVKGKGLPEIREFTYYHEGPDGKFALDEDQEVIHRYMYGQFNLINDWWPSTIQ